MWCASECQSFQICVNQFTILSRKTEANKWPLRWQIWAIRFVLVFQHNLTSDTNFWKRKTNKKNNNKYLKWSNELEHDILSSYVHVVIYNRNYRSPKYQIQKNNRNLLDSSNNGLVRLFKCDAPVNVTPFRFLSINSPIFRKIEADKKRKSIRRFRDRRSSVMEVSLVLTHLHWWDKANPRIWNILCIIALNSFLHIVHASNI